MKTEQVPAKQLSLVELEEFIKQLSPEEQLRLVANITLRLSYAMLASPTVPGLLAKVNETEIAHEREKEADKLDMMLDEVAELWDQEFDPAEDIRQMRQERGEQIWPSGS